MLPPRERYQSGSEVIDGRTCGQTKQQTRDGARNETMVAITELLNVGAALLAEAIRPGVTLEIVTQVEHEIQ